MMTTDASNTSLLSILRKYTVVLMTSNTMHLTLHHLSWTILYAHKHDRSAQWIHNLCQHTRTHPCIVNTVLTLVCTIVLVLFSWHLDAFRPIFILDVLLCTQTHERSKYAAQRDAHTCCCTAYTAHPCIVNTVLTLVCTTNLKRQPFFRLTFICLGLFCLSPSFCSKYKPYP